MQRPHLPEHSFLRALPAGLVLAFLLTLNPAAQAGDRQPPPEADHQGEEIADLDLDRLPGGMPTIEDFGYFLRGLKEWEKDKALNVLADLASDTRLDPGRVGSVLRSLLEEAIPPTGLGYCRSCFQRQLSDVLSPLRLRGPEVEAPAEGVIALRIDEQFLKRLRPEALAEVGGTVPGLVQALLDGWSIAGKFKRGSYVRFHAPQGETVLEPAFFTSAAELGRFEASLSEPLDDWSLSRWLCQRTPQHRFEAGLLLLYFDPAQGDAQVRIPTAGDTEEARFRPVPLSETQSGQTCGGAPEWVTENLPMSAFTRGRYVANRVYIEGM